MPNFALSVAIACALYAGNVSAGPVPRTNALLSQASNAFPSSASTFRAPDLTLSPKIDISPRDTVSSDPTNLHHHRALASFERRDLIFRRGGSSPTGNSSPPPTSQDGSIAKLKAHVEQQEMTVLGPYFRYTETEMRLTHNFLFSLGDQYSAEQIHPFVEGHIKKAERIKERFANGCPSYIEKTMEVTTELLNLYKQLNSSEKKTLTSASSEVQSKLEEFSEDINSNLSKWEGEEGTLEPSIVKMLTGWLELWNLRVQSAERGDKSYLEERKKAAWKESYAQYVSKQGRLLQAAKAAKNFLQFLATLNGQGTKRKAPEGDHEDAPNGQKIKI